MKTNLNSPIRVAICRLMLLLAIGGAVLRSSAAEFSVIVYDGLGRPLQGVTVNVTCSKRNATNAKPVFLAKVMSDVDGLAKGTYNDATFATNDVLSVELSKAGYAGYVGGPQVEYVLKKQFKPEDVARIAKLSTESQKTELRELLGGDFDSSKETLDDVVFFNSKRLRPGLKALVPDSRIGLKAGELLALIAVPDDMKTVVQYAPSAKREAAVDRWAVKVLSALLDPPGEREWLFLKQCALNEYKNADIEAAAIRTLRLNATPRSLELLKEVRKQNKARTNEIDAAIAYINSPPPPLSDKNLSTAGEKVAAALKGGNWHGNYAARYSEDKDMALIDCEFQNGRQVVVHTATFQKVNEEWKLRGVRQTRESLLPRTAVR